MHNCAIKPSIANVKILIKSEKDCALKGHATALSPNTKAPKYIGFFLSISFSAEEVQA